MDPASRIGLGVRVLAQGSFLGASFPQWLGIGTGEGALRRIISLQNSPMILDSK